MSFLVAISSERIIIVTILLCQYYITIDVNFLNLVPFFGSPSSTQAYLYSLTSLSSFSLYQVNPTRDIPCLGTTDLYSSRLGISLSICLVEQMASICLFLSMAVTPSTRYSWFKNSFLHGDLDNEVYMEKLTWFVAKGGSIGLVCHIYKQYLRAWFDWFSIWFNSLVRHWLLFH